MYETGLRLGYSSSFLKILIVGVSLLSLHCCCNWHWCSNRQVCLRIRSGSVGLVSFVDILMYQIPKAGAL